MSENIYFSKSIKLSDIKKKCKQLKLGKQEGLYGDTEIPTYPITHKEFPGERVYVIFNEYKDDTLNAKLGENCDDKEFCEVERFYGDEDYHIMLVLSGTFDIKYTSDPRAWMKGEFHRYILNYQNENEFMPIFTKENGNLKDLNLEKIVFPKIEETEIDYSNNEELKEEHLFSESLFSEDAVGKNLTGN